MVDAVDVKVLPQAEIPEKWTQAPPCFAITTKTTTIKIAHQKYFIYTKYIVYDIFEMSPTC